MDGVSTKTYFGVSALIIVAMVTITGGDHVIMNPFVSKAESTNEIALIIVPERGLLATDYEMFGEYKTLKYPVRVVSTRATKH
ncbi:hypothetical protein ElyMa_002527600 [Elysia marginata]|uniref:Uncharacterized protein n=1 Tax=Elysia marginata TaxID=1093978 RepID=A0AAV4GSJ1_9GAST|nr:hypothetical protein ElyMa_002527600 [Elysia marginata]